MANPTFTAHLANLDRHLSRSDALACLEIIHSTLDCKDHQGLCAALIAVANLIEADYSACLISSRDQETDADRIVIVDASFPVGWLDHYAQSQFHLIDPIITENFSRFGLQYWGDTYQKAPPPRTFLSEAESAGLGKGFSYGLQSDSRTGGSLFSFSGPRLPPHPRTTVILERVLPHLHRVLGQLDAGEPSGILAIPLSGRELEVLKWISVGKSSWDTGMILQISERTVNFHIKNLLLKLDAVNRPQAVAKALRLGLLQLP
jgi:DNA-binding CsgD family transcriptional regulator